MNLRLRKYNISKESKNKVKELYFSAFPKYEQLPYWMMKLLSRKRSADFYSIYDKKDFVGLAYVATYKDTAYLFFFAIDEKQRGKGYGSAFLSALKEKYKDYRILLAIEQLDQNAPNIDERIKRKNFYTKNGFYDLNFTMTEQSVTYDMLGYNKDNKTVTEKEFFYLNKNFFGKIFYNLFYKRIYVEPKMD